MIKLTMKRDDAKVRILLIERMIRYDKIINSTEILHRLEQRGIYADRKTIYDDIAAINMIIPVESVNGKNGGFRYVDVIGRCDNDGYEK